jgi:hypothetical protein
MKLKYYMRGLGVGILLTTLLFTLCGYQKKLSDQEIINLAKGLGMETAENEEDPLDKVLGEMAKADEQDSSEAVPDAAEEQAANSDGESPEDQTAGQTPEPSVESTEGQTTGTNGESTAAGQTANSNGGSPEGQTAGQTPEPSVKPTEGQATGTDEKATTGQTSESAAESSDQASTSTKNATQTDHEEATITIKQGMTSDSVSKLLYKAGIVDDAKKFNDYIVKTGKSTKILIGEFTFSKNASYDDIIKKIAE